ncbi:hypothetical protein [Baaleninema simplex]|nr:hypothetical protein [Baaleninema simplex]
MATILVRSHRKAAIAMEAVTACPDAERIDVLNPCRSTALKA